MMKVFVICMALYIVLPGVSAAGSLTDNGDGTVTDSGTLLTWQQGDSSTKTWEAALSYCEGLTLAAQNDWRLPNIKELSSLVDDARYLPAIDKALFPSASSYYWTSTTYVSSPPSAAWHVNFTDGSSSADEKTFSKYVRCVRGGQ